LRETTVAALNADQYANFYRKRNPLDSALKFQNLSPQVAYLTINSFHESYRKMFKQDFETLFEEIFSGLDSVNIPNLVVDLRRCEGGDNSSLWLLAYLMNKPFKVYDYLEVNYSGYPEVSKYFEDPETSILVDSFLQKMPSGKYRLKNEKAASVPGVLAIEPKAHNFRGNLYVLISGATGSAAAIVASILKGNNRATFIGEESGGAMEGPTSLNISTLILPHTKIRIEIPHIRLQLAVPFTKGRGVLPDYPVQISRNDLISGNDTQLKFAINLISKNAQ
jgi:C-terminal processing protease CtpA/Prc